MLGVWATIPGMQFCFRKRASGSFLSAWTSHPGGPSPCSSLRLDLRKVVLSAEVLHAAARVEVPWGLMHPFTSVLWQAPIVRSLISDNCSMYSPDCCQFDCPCKYKLRVCVSNLDHSALTLACGGRKGLCSRTRAPHTPPTARNFRRSMVCADVTPTRLYQAVADM